MKHRSFKKVLSMVLTFAASLCIMNAGATAIAEDVGVSKELDLLPQRWSQRELGEHQERIDAAIRNGGVVDRIAEQLREWKAAEEQYFSEIGLLNSTQSSGHNYVCCCERWEIRIISGTVHIMGRYLEKWENIVNPHEVILPGLHPRRNHPSNIPKFPGGVSPYPDLMRVTHIAANAFQNLQAIRVIDIPATVFFIGPNAFRNLGEVDYVTFRRADFTFFGSRSHAFDGTNIAPGGSFNVPFGFVGAYRETLDIWAGVRNRALGFCPATNPMLGHPININNVLCTCCSFRRGDVTGTGVIQQNDANQIRRYVWRQFPNAIQQSANAPIDWDAFDAALATKVSRQERTPHTLDATDIERAMSRRCSWTNTGSHANVPPCLGTCPQNHCHL
jgi:hypothetical protein